MFTAIVYHEVKPGIACPDGIAAAWVARINYPYGELIGASYGGEVPDLSGYQNIVIVDFSFSLEVLQGWMSAGCSVTVIDHHKTAMSDLSQFEGAVFDMDESGATLTWKHFFPDEPVPAWLEYVKDRDLWNFDLPMSEEIHEAISFTGRSLRQIDFYCGLTSEELQAMFGPLGEKLLAPKRERIAQIAETAQPCVVAGCNAMIVSVDENESRLVSDVCSAVYKAHPEADFVMGYSWKSSEELFALAFRSDKKGNDFDVSVIAKQFGSGGHRNAAGASARTLNWVVTYDNGSGYREWATVKQPLPQLAIEACGVSGLNGFGNPLLKLV